MKLRYGIVLSVIFQLIFLCVHVECQFLSLLAVASLAGLLKPKTPYPPQHFIPQANYHSNYHHSDSVAASGSHHSYRTAPAPSMYGSPYSSAPRSPRYRSRSPSYPGSQSPYGSSQDSPKSARDHLTSTFSNWRNSLVSHPESQKVPSHYGKYPENGYQFFHGPPDQRVSEQFARKGIKPVFYPNGVGDHYKSKPMKGRSLFKL
ncbi:uncharacterized protein LOC141857441 [Brevipalpus obovatus]|uniref:uncharacterized protein LOC141857441 n=1 Tax=Brevipalpus obovatus TaxID=246614 RepID=UPI003D9F5324